MTENLKQICKSAAFGLWKVGRIRKLLDQTHTERLVHAFITSRLDYCNSLLSNLPDEAIQKLQRFQNQAARQVLKREKRPKFKCFWQEN